MSNISISGYYARPVMPTCINWYKSNTKKRILKDNGVILKRNVCENKIRHYLCKQTTKQFYKNMGKHAGTQPENNEIRIYQSQYKSLSLAVMCLLFVTGGIFILNDDDCTTTVKLIGGWLNIAFFGLGGLLQLFATLHNRIKNIPFIIISDSNVSFYVQFKKSYHTINFDDVKQFRIISIYGSKMIAVDYKKNVMEQLFDGSNGITTQLMTYNLKKTGAAISIPTANLTMKAKDICAILNKRIDGKYPSKG